MKNVAERFGARLPVQLKTGPLCGRITVVGDKSISHRALLFGAKSSRRIRIRNVNPGRDVLATQSALQSIGTRIDRKETELTVDGGELLHDPRTAIDCMNSGSTARMMMGVLAGANLRANLIGDASLSQRPMEPAAAQLRAFGARISTTAGTLPISICGTADPQTRHFIMLTQSAQIKAALLLAGVFAGVPLTIENDKGTRDHTERMLSYFCADVRRNGTAVELRSMPTDFRDVDVPGDFSAAAFFIVAATVTPESSVVIENVGVNPRRTGLLEALQAMGARIELRKEREYCGEPVADIAVESAPLQGIAVSPALALRAIDEIPVLAVAAAFAHGATTIDGIADLRGKESDRIAGTQRLLQCAGISTTPSQSGIAITGGDPRSTGAVVDCRRDHRIAMAAAALAAGAGPLRLDDESVIDVSFPGFLQTWAAVQR